MRIVFLGKGGSGKTTTTAAFIKHLSKSKKHVLAIDADVNVHLQSALNIKGETNNVSENYSAITTYLQGQRELDTNFIGTTPPSLKSNFIKPHLDDEFIQKFALQSQNISLLTVGTYNHDDLGTTCYHGKLMGLEAILHHLIDTKEDWVITDATAGVDIGTSLCLAYDLNIFVVEPTLKSIKVFQDFLKFSKELGLNTKCLINKYEPEDEEFLKKHIPEDLIIGKLPISQHIKRYEQGVEDAFDQYVEQCSLVFQRIEQEAMQLPNRDWDQYLDSLTHLHVRISKAWYNDYYSQDLATQIDKEFTYNLIT